MTCAAVRRFAACLIALAWVASACDTMAQATSGELKISWEVRNRFRLFREEKDFLLHAEALRGRSVLEAEQLLAVQSDGRGWARNMLARLCIDGAGRIADPCVRDGIGEDYLAPTDHLVSVRLEGADGAPCAWRFDDGDRAPQTVDADCAEPINVHARYGRPMIATVDVSRPEGGERITGEIMVRDLLIAGLGDSVASGEGNPDRPIALADEGFCFRQLSGSERLEYFRPARAGFKGDRSCEAGSSAEEWNRLSARWFSAACHRSLYSYQLRTALALAVENRHIAVTFLPLACTGASIDAGLLNAQPARELNCGVGRCPGTAPAQLTRLQNLLDGARKRDPNRRLDLVLLTIGANDINFSGLVADVIVDSASARSLLRRSGLFASVDGARAALEQKLPRDFMRLRSALRPLVGDLARVVYVSYAHPALAAADEPCPGGRLGFDIHPSFGVDAARLRRVSDFVQSRFLPTLGTLATCTAGTICADQNDRMTFVDAHQVAFAGHGICARAPSDPAFDNDCFSPDGQSFTANLVEAANAPLACDQSPSAFRAYLPRARWIRTANDAYFAAMTYPQGVGGLEPSDIHDASWGLLSAVYGGAVHPTAEGHAAMADAALAAARTILQLAPSEDSILMTPLSAPEH
jgi:hypothetical protein